MGVILLLVYANDLPDYVERSTVRMFADDTTLTAHAKSVAENESVEGPNQVPNNMA